MFGYVIADLARLDTAQQMRYKSFYCGLCRALYRGYGPVPALALTYDMAFLDARGFSLAAVLEPVLRNLHLYSLVLLTALFTGVFLALPARRQRFVHVLPGAAGAACAGVVYSEIYSWYVNHIAKASALYGSLSVLLLMLLWLYACISILFYGALLNHALFDWKEEKEKPECSDT